MRWGGEGMYVTYRNVADFLCCWVEGAEGA